MNPTVLYALYAASILGLAVGFCGCVVLFCLVLFRLVK